MASDGLIADKPRKDGGRKKPPGYEFVIL